MGSFKGRDVISILDFERDELELLFRWADWFEARLVERRVPKLLEGWLVSLAFFEPSTRTRMSFEAAVKRLGGEAIGFTSEEAISVAKGESLADTIRMLDAYSDLIVIRHRFEGAALYAAEVADKPVINAGDGKQHHPTQAMLDLYTVSKLFGSPDGLVYAVLGDLRYSRAATSFLYGLTLFKPKMVYLVSPPQLRLREEVKMVLVERGLPMREVDNIAEVIGEVDVLYVVRIQRERFPDPMEYERVRGSYRVTPELVRRGKPTLRILHPLPKVDEIDPRVDEMEQAAYFYQARLGVPLRMALVSLVTGVVEGEPGR